MQSSCRLKGLSVSCWAQQKRTLDANSRAKSKYRVPELHQTLLGHDISRDEDIVGGRFGYGLKDCGSCDLCIRFSKQFFDFFPTRSTGQKPWIKTKQVARTLSGRGCTGGGLNSGHGRRMESSVPKCAFRGT